MDSVVQDGKDIQVREEDSHPVNINDEDNNAKDGKEEKSTRREGPAYHYLTRDGAQTSELFKVEIRNLPRFASYGSLKKMIFKEVRVKPQKIKIVGNPPKFAFVAFKSEEDKTLAIDILDKYDWKGSTLSVVVAAPKADPLVVKRLHEEDGEGIIKKERLDSEIPSEQLEQRVNNQVCNLWNLSPKEQLEKKMEIVNEFLIELHKDIGKMIESSKKETIERGEESKEVLFNWFIRCRRENDKKSCTPNPIVSSPLLNGYRNKCEFSIGQDLTVGFRLGAYKDGQVEVGPVDSCPLIAEGMLKIIKDFETFLSQSLLKPFDYITHNGQWKQLMIRSNKKNQHMIMATLDIREVSDEVLEAEKKKLVQFLTNENSTVISIFLEYISKADRKQKEDRFHLIYGAEVIQEDLTIHDKTLTFNISPTAFFQINTPAAQLCYEQIGDPLQLDSSTILLDVCCGTGTIGLSLAHRVGKVIGIELSADAVSDAKKNAVNNNICNAEFRVGKAEEVLPRLLTSKFLEEFDKVIAVIDPPRAGLNQTVIKALRSVDKLTRLVYVSCDPKFAKQNLIDLCRPTSKVYRGIPFVPVKVTPVDMFPHTPRCEVVFLYERLPMKDSVAFQDKEEPNNE